MAPVPWPPSLRLGNVRELLHALERAVLRCEGDILKIHHFPDLEVPALRRRTWE